MKSDADDLARDLLQGAREALAYARGEADPSAYVVTAPEAISVAKVRQAIGDSQRQFAERVGVPVRTVQGWERKTKLDASTRVLIGMVAVDPDVVRKTLGSNDNADAHTASELEHA
ncbi:MAG: helix-turn-helix domain-containing protein [Pseudomonadota bacterium]